MPEITSALILCNRYRWGHIQLTCGEKKYLNWCQNSATFHYLLIDVNHAMHCHVFPVHLYRMYPCPGPWTRSKDLKPAGADLSWAQTSVVLYFTLDQNMPSLALLMPACTIGHTFTCTEKYKLCCLQVAAGALFTPWTCALHVSLKNQRRSQKLSYDIERQCYFFLMVLLVQPSTIFH